MDVKINYFMAKNCNKPFIFAVKYVALTLEMAKGRPADTIARPTSLSRITITTEGSNTCGIPQKLSE